MKDNEKRELVSRLAYLAREFADTEQLRERIAGAVLPALEAAEAAERERCAKLCETMRMPAWVETTGDVRDALAEALRGPNAELK